MMDLRKGNGDITLDIAIAKLKISIAHGPEVGCQVQT